MILRRTHRVVCGNSRRQSMAAGSGKAPHSLTVLHLIVFAVMCPPLLSYAAGSEHGGVAIAAGGSSGGLALFRWVAGGSPERTTVLAGEGVVSNCVLSPDVKLLLWVRQPMADVRDGGDAGDLFVAALADLTRSDRLTKPGGRAAFPVWLPGPLRILASMHDDGGISVWDRSGSGWAASRLGAPHFLFDCRPCPDGTLVAYTENYSEDALLCLGMLPSLEQTGRPLLDAENVDYAWDQDTGGLIAAVDWRDSPELRGLYAFSKAELIRCMSDPLRPERLLGGTRVSLPSGLRVVAVQTAADGRCFVLTAGETTPDHRIPSGRIGQVVLNSGKMEYVTPPFSPGPIGAYRQVFWCSQDATRALVLTERQGWPHTPGPLLYWQAGMSGWQPLLDNAVSFACAELSPSD
jgi:hypothetical protein